MIKREHIKQAIDFLSRRDPEIGYALDEMLGMGIIDTPTAAHKTVREEELYFIFVKEKVYINKFLYFNRGPGPIEERLLVKYGELVKKQELSNGQSDRAYGETARQIHRAGLKFMVTHEIDYAMARVREHSDSLVSEDKALEKGFCAEDGTGSPDRDKTCSGDALHDIILQLKGMKQNQNPIKKDLNEKDAIFCYRGTVHKHTPATFVRFPFCMDALIQVADINMEFFNVRFILDCLLGGHVQNLFACLVEGKIVGLVFLSFVEKGFYRGLEIKYMATLRGRDLEDSSLMRPPLKGVGTFLIAGVWFQWKNEFQKAGEILLDAEVGARQFYDAMGFDPRGLSSYVLKQPKGYLTRAILNMANHHKNLDQDLVKDMETIIKKQVKALRKRVKDEKGLSMRKAGIEAIEECLKPEALPPFQTAAQAALIKYKKRIPEAEELLENFKSQGSWRNKGVKR